MAAWRRFLRCIEVLAVERLQWVAKGDLFVREATREVVSQFAHHHRRRDARILAQFPTRIGHEERSPCREEGCEESQSVFIPKVAVTGPARVGGNDVEGRRRLLARESAVVHANRANDFRRENLSGTERRNGDAIGEPCDGAGTRGAQLKERLSHHRERNGALDAGDTPFLFQILDQPRNRVRFSRHLGHQVFGGKEGFQHRLA